MARYEEALALVKRKGGIKLAELANELCMPWGTALKFLELMERQSVILPADTRGFRATVHNSKPNNAEHNFGEQINESEEKSRTIGNSS